MAKNTLNPSDFVACWITWTSMPLPAPAAETAIECVDRHIMDYDGMGKRALFKDKTWKFIQLVAAAVIPICALSNDGWARVTSACLGATIGIASGVAGMCQYHDNWLRWRRTWQQLSLERHAYIHKATADYKSDAKRDAKLMSRVSEIL